MSFADRMIRWKTQEVQLSDVEKSGDPEALAAEFVQFGSEKEDQLISYPRASGLYEDCMRMRVLGKIYKVKYTQWTSFRDRITYGIGSALHYWVQNTPDVLGNRRIGWWKCYDDETEVLTEKGFKLFKDVVQHDRIATLNPDTGYLEYYLPVAKQVYPYSGPMYDFSDSNLVSLCVTPDHSMYVKKYPRRKNAEFGLCPVSDLDDVYGFQFKKDCLWAGEEFFPTLPGVLRVSLTDYVRFFAWWLSEGCVAEGGNNSYRIHIFQTQGLHASNCDEIARLLTRLGVKWSVARGRDFYFYSKKLFLHLQQFGHARDKYVPFELKQLPPEFLREFLRVYTLGDGTDCQGRQALYTTSPRMRDDLQEIIQKVGWSSSYFEDGRESHIEGSKKHEENSVVYHIVVNKRKLQPHFGKRYGTEMRKVDYEGMVYDLTVPNHIMLIRRRGKIVWSGNCLACGNVVSFGRPPTRRCPKCNALKAAMEYHEHVLKIEKPLFLTGHPDMFTEVKPTLFRVSEIKSMAGDQFEKLAAPLIQHLWQLQSYMWACSLDGSDLPVAIDPSIGYMMYISKKHSAGKLPVKVFPVERDEVLLKRIKAKLRVFKKGYLNYPKHLPELADECKRKDFDCWRAKSCPVLQRCKKAAKNDK